MKESKLKKAAPQLASPFFVIDGRRVIFTDVILSFEAILDWNATQLSALLKEICESSAGSRTFLNARVQVGGGPIHL